MHNGQQAEFPLRQSAYVLGRGEGRIEPNRINVEDAALSRDHATVSVEAGGVRVTALKNRQALLLHGEMQQSFLLSAGDSFKSGYTRFELRQEAEAPTTSLTEERLQEAQMANPREMLEALLKIQPLLSGHQAVEDMFAQLLPLLSEVVRGAASLLAIQVNADGSQQVLASHGRAAEPSQTLIRRCLNEEQAIYHIWTGKPADGGVTAYLGASWALAAPILCQPESYVLYALGLERVRASKHNQPSTLDRSVLTLVASQVSKHLQGNRAGLLAAQVEAERSRRLLSENLRNLTRSVSASLDARVVLDNLLNYLQPLVGYEAGGGYLYVGGEFRPQVKRGRERKWPRWPGLFVLPKGELMEILPLPAQTPEAELLGLTDQPHWLLLFLVSQKELQGLVVLGRREPFSAEQIEVASSFASQVGMAVQNARLFAKVRSQAIQDELTGLFNRRHFFELARERWPHPEPLSIVLFDIDRFKSINDNYGHDVGDIALKHVARTIGRQLKPGETPARLGGEEFAVLVTGTLEQAREAAERWRRGLETSTCRVSPELDLKVTTSLGVATRRPTDKNAEEILKRADQALYRAKGAGRNRVALEEP